MGQSGVFLVNLLCNFILKLCEFLAVLLLSELPAIALQRLLQRLKVRVKHTWISWVVCNMLILLSHFIG